MKACKIKLRPGSKTSMRLTEIDEIYISGCVEEGFYKKEVLHDYVTRNPGTIVVNRPPYPDLVPAVSKNGEKYVRSEPNDTPFDNLLRLPRV